MKSPTINTDAIWAFCGYAASLNNAEWHLCKRTRGFFGVKKGQPFSANWLDRFCAAG